jgi:hypothetical protein
MSRDEHHVCLRHADIRLENPRMYADRPRSKDQVFIEFLPVVHKPPVCPSGCTRRHDAVASSLQSEHQSGSRTSRQSCAKHATLEVPFPRFQNASSCRRLAPDHFIMCVRARPRDEHNALRNMELAPQRSQNGGLILTPGLKAPSQEQELISKAVVIWF